MMYYYSASYQRDIVLPALKSELFYANLMRRQRDSVSTMIVLVNLHVW